MKGLSSGMRVCYINNISEIIPQTHETLTKSRERVGGGVGVGG